MTSKNVDLMNELNSLLNFNSEDEKIQLEAELIHMRYIHALEKLMNDRDKNKSFLAEKLKTSKSYITQLFSGSKLLNFKSLAKIQRAFDVSFSVEVTSNRRRNFLKVDYNRFSNGNRCQDRMRFLQEDNYTPILKQKLIC